MIKATHFEAKKHAYRQTQDGIVISFVVHPNDLSAEVATAPLGTRYMVAFAQIGDDEQPTEQPKPERPKRKFDELTCAEQAGILCADPKFQKWLGVLPDHDGEAYAAETVRDLCDVTSRALIGKTGASMQKWTRLVTGYRQATGQLAEQRG
jgi:hypothetical protein